jgi:hypothetical protein
MKFIYAAFAIFGLACFAVSPTAQAVVPAPDGCYPGENTVEGDSALFSLTANGVRNTAIGFNALFSNTGGGANTAIGASALASNTANDNTACGSYALANNTTGSGNTAFGIDALMLNINGNSNHASGHDALFNNTGGNANTASGANALFSNTTGNNNTAEGVQVLFSNTTGSSNTANGFNALASNTTGSNNTTLGFRAGFNLTTGNGNVCIGKGVLGVSGENNTTRITNVYSSVASGRAVYVNSDNKFGTLVSSRRFKDDIKPMDKASETILALKPVTFRYKKEIEPSGAIMFGLIAEEVEKVDPELVTRNAKGEVETVRYDAVNAMLLNEFLKQHHQVQEQDRKLEAQDRKMQQQQAVIAKQQKQIDALTMGLQKVSAELELSKPAPETVLNNP